LVERCSTPRRRKMRMIRKKKKNRKGVKRWIFGGEEVDFWDKPMTAVKEKNRDQISYMFITKG
jgi:hypothetical protein